MMLDSRAGTSLRSTMYAVLFRRANNKIKKLVSFTLPGVRGPHTVPATISRVPYHSGLYKKHNIILLFYYPSIAKLCTVDGKKYYYVTKYEHSLYFVLFV